MKVSFLSGEAIYEIGVEDNGLMTGLSEEDLESSLDTLREMARWMKRRRNINVQIHSMGFFCISEDLRPLSTS